MREKCCACDEIAEGEYRDLDDSVFSEAIRTLIKDPDAKRVFICDQCSGGSNMPVHMP